MKPDFFATALKRFSLAQEHERDERERAQEDFEFSVGDQWHESIKALRQKAGQPCLTFNRLPQFVSQVVNDAKMNAPSVAVHPVDSNGDPDIAEIYAGLIRNIEAQSQAQQVYMWGLTCSVTGGMGHWQVVTKYADDDSFEQDIRLERIVHPFAVYWDPNSKNPNKTDAKWCFVTEWMTKEAFEEEYPDHAPASWEIDWRDVRSDWALDDLVRVAAYYYLKPVKRTLALLQDGATVDITDIEGQAYAAMQAGTLRVAVNKETGQPRIREVDSHKVCRVVLNGKEIIEKEAELVSKYIPIVSVYGPEEFDGQRIRHRSLIRYAKDPQRMYNYWQTAITEKIALAPKAPFLLSPKQIEGHSAVWNSANRENRAYLLFNPDPQNPGAPQRQQPAAINAAEIQQSAQAIDDLKASMGMYDASLGNKGNETSGRAIIARQKEGDTATFGWVDSLAKAIEHTGRILLDMIPKIYDTERVVRVLGVDDSAELIEINKTDGSGAVLNDLTVGKYDLIMSVGPSYATRRLEAAESMMGFVQAFPESAPVIGDLIAKNMDWPGAEEIAERLKKMLPPGIAEEDGDLTPEEQAQRQQQLQQQMQEQEEAKQIMKAKEIAEIELKKDQADKARADSMRVQAEIRKILVEADAQEIENRAVLAGIAQFGPIAHTQVDDGQTETRTSGTTEAA